MTEPQVGCASVPRHGIVASSDDVFKQRHRVSESPFFATLMTSEFGDASEVLGNSHPVKLVRGVYVPHPVFRHYVFLVRYEIEKIENEIHLLLLVFEDIVCEK